MRLPLLSPAMLLVAFFSCFGQTFEKGQRIRLTHDADLIFKEGPARHGAAGEVFEVISQRGPDSVYVLTDDALGNPVVAQVKASAVEAALPVSSPTPSTKPSEATVSSTSAVKVEDSVYLVRTDHGQGSAFLTHMGSRSYFITNYHVLRGAKTAEFASSAESINLQPASEVEVALDRDLVRIPVNKQGGLLASAPPNLNEEIGVYGNPGGARVITKETGRLLGVGPSEVEVSAEFIPGNSGGPIADSQGKIFAVATYLVRRTDMQKWITSKTRFEAARRFGVRLSDDIRWEPTTWGQFAADTTLVAAANSFLDDALNLTKALATDPYRAPFVSKVTWTNEIAHLRAAQIYAGLIAAYNSSCDERGRMTGTIGSNADLSRVNSFFATRIRAHVSTLGNCLKDAAVDLNRVFHTFSTEHSKHDYAEVTGHMTELASLLERVSKNTMTTNVFGPSSPSPAR